MKTFCVITCSILVVFLVKVNAQIPPRLSIPGAILLPQSKPLPYRQQRIQLQPDSGLPPRIRSRPPQFNAPAPIRPVVEEVEESSPSSNNFDDEVSKLGISVLQSAVRQAAEPEDEVPVPKPLPFRPERPLPVLRQDVRENSSPIPRPLPVLRQEAPQRPILRQENSRPIDRDEAPLLRPSPPTRVRQQVPQQLPPAFRQPARVNQPARQPTQYLDDGENPGRTRKPPVQILRKYRTDNADGSITWGYENEDGTFKEENLGNDCVTRGKYGYIDPDGVKREYSYETGNKCDQIEEEELIPEGKLIQPQPRKPLPQQPQFRPGPAQYN